MDLPIALARCTEIATDDLDPGRSITVVPQSHDDALNEKQLIDYKTQRIRFLSWLLNFGKNPDRADGYAQYTVYSTAYRSARFDLWVWQERGEYVYPPLKTDADQFLEHSRFR